MQQGAAMTVRTSILLATAALVAMPCALAQDKGLSLSACAARYATASLPDRQQGGRFHEWLGFTAGR